MSDSSGVDAPDEPEIEILAVEFEAGYGAADITYVERRNVSDKAFKREVVTFTTEILSADDKADFLDVIETLSHCLDEAQRYIRANGS